MSSFEVDWEQTYLLQPLNDLKKKVDEEPQCSIGGSMNAFRLVPYFHSTLPEVLASYTQINGLP